MHDVLNANGSFLSFDEFKNKFNIKANLYYFQLIAAIPQCLKTKTAKNAVPYTVCDFLSMTATPPIETSINIIKMHCKTYHKMFYGNCSMDPSGIRNWQNKFPNC